MTPARRVDEGEAVELVLDGAVYRLPVRFHPALPRGVAGLPAGLRGLLAGSAGWGRISRAFPPRGVSRGGLCKLCRSGSPTFVPLAGCLRRCGVGQPSSMNQVTQSLLIVIGVLFAAMTVSAGLIWVERRLLALWQDRYGPNRVGPFGLLQVVADMIKIFAKEDWIPPFADKPVFMIAPAVVVVDVRCSFAVIPIAPGIGVADLNVGLLFFLAMSSMGVYSVVLAGWASNNKYSLLGGLRAAAQMLSYEVFMGLR